MRPFYEPDGIHQLTVVNIVEIFVWVVGVIDDECAAQPIAILCRQMAVIPVRPCVAVRQLD